MSPGATLAVTLAIFLGGVVGGAAVSARWFEPVFTRLARRCRVSQA